ncbi:MAG: hypothetical protein IJO28_06330 [Oscillospiraceae bacterium]|nr:hypothetical protein [Oscillospiraceae bacterium]
MKKIHFIGQEKFLPGMAEIQNQLGFVLDENGYEVSCRQGCEGITVDVKDHKAAVTYGKDCLFFRAFSLAVEHVDGPDRHISVQCQFEHYGTMQNTSSHVMSVRGVKDLLVQHALMGYDYMELYTEICYEVPEEPYFGYMKGRFSQQELKELAAFGDKMFVELVPSVQTLGHMSDLFKWGAYSDVFDIAGTLLVDYERTYELIERMLRSLRQCYTTNRINLGMDEAYFMGKGRYHWFVDDTLPDPSMMYIRHLKRVLEIAKKVGFTDLAIWYDNLFEINYKGYINPPLWLWKDFKKEITDNFPEVRLIFWNYVIRDVEDFKRFVGYIRQLSPHVSFASMVHGYTSFAPENYITASLVDTAKAGCAACGIDDLMITWWGGKSSSLAQLGGYYHYIESCGTSEGYDFEEHCKFLFGYTYEELCALDLPNKIEPDMGSTGMAEGNNPCFYILAEDPLLGTMSAHIPENAAETYASHAKVLQELAQRQSPFSYIYKFEQVLCDTLASKADLSLIVKDAYDRGDKESLKQIAQEKIPVIVEKMNNFRDAYYEYWCTYNRSLGWERYENMLGGHMYRLQKVAKLLLDYCDGKVERIEELEQERLPVNPNKVGHVIGNGSWYGISTVGH